MTFEEKLALLKYAAPKPGFSRADMPKGGFEVNKGQGFFQDAGKGLGAIESVTRPAENMVRGVGKSLATAGDSVMQSAKGAINSGIQGVKSTWNNMKDTAAKANPFNLDNWKK